MTSTVCLNMIVRDEAHVIERCLQSVRPHIDSYCIVDTGSTDGTQDVIRKFLADVPGEVHERPWVDFGFNRTEAIQLAKGKTDYLLVIDADDTLVGMKPMNLVHDEIALPIEHAGNTHIRTQIFRSTLPFRYVGVIHEYLHCDVEIRADQRVYMPSLVYRVGGGGARSQLSIKEKYLKDAATLERALLTEPDNERYVYYLAQSYKDAGEYAKAIDVFEKRAAMANGRAEETFLALEWIAKLTETLAGYTANKATVERIEKAYLRAYEYRPSRLEPLHDLCDYLNRHGKYRRTYELSHGTLNTPIPNDAFMVDRSVYDWRMKDLFLTAAFHIGKRDVSRLACEELLNSRRLPMTEIERIVQNMHACSASSEG